jgi:uncharacterized protein involved in exopolysaccharide biosynthesis/Mrp family chromosome partitioning ATPase
MSLSAQPTNLSDVFGGLARRKWLIIGTTLAGILGGTLFSMWSKASYSAEALVIIENLATPFDKSTAVQDVTSAEGQVSDRMVASQVSVLKSNDINARVVDELSLDAKPEYNSQLREPGMIGKLAISLGFKDDPRAYQPKALAAKNLAANVSVYAVPDSNTIGIKSTSGTPELAAATANAIAETYVLSTHENGASSNDRVRTWLGKQIDDLRAKVSASDNAVEKYRAEAGLLKGATSTLGIQQISELNSQITVAETASAEAEARANEIRSILASRGQVDASADVLSSGLVQNLREQQGAAQRKLSELSAVYLPNHPKMIAARQELNAVNNQIRTEALKVVDSLIGQAKVAKARAASLHASLDKLKGSEAQANFSDVKLKELEREAEANRTMLQNMLNRYADANARQDTSLQPGFARVIQKAVVPATPYFPKLGPILSLSTLAGLALGLGLGFVLELLSAPAPDTRNQSRRRHPARQADLDEVEVPDIDLKEADDAFAEVTAPVAPIASPPPVRERAAGIIGAMPAALTPNAAFGLLEDMRAPGDSKFAEATQRLADNLVSMKKARSIFSFALTSLGAAVPNSAMVSIALARALANRGEKVVALDVARPGSGFDALLGLPTGPGLLDLIAGQADFTKIVARDSVSPLHVVRLGQFPDANAQTNLAPKFEAIIKALKTIYAYVLIHAGEAGAAVVPLLQLSDVTIIMASASRLKDADAAANALDESGANKAMILKLEADVAAKPSSAATA